MNLKTVAHIAGALSYAATQWFLLTFAARFISLETAGLYAYFLALYTPASILLSFGLRNSIASDSASLFYSKEYELAKNAGIVGFLIYFLILNFFVEQSVVISALVFLLKAVDMASETVYGNWIRDKKAHLYGVSRFLKLILFLIGFYLFYLWGGERAEILLSCPLAAFLVYFFFDRRYAGYNNAQDRRGRVFSLIRLSAPLAFSAFIISLNVALPRLFIMPILGEEEVAIYTILFYFCSLAVIPITSVCQIYIPRFSRYERGLDFFLDRKSRSILACIFVYAIAFYIAMYFGLNLFAKFAYGLAEDYSARAIFILFLVALLQFLNTIFNAVLISLRDFKGVMISSLVGVLLTIFITYPLVKYYSLDGAYLGYLLVCTAFLVCTLFRVLNATRRI